MRKSVLLASALLLSGCMKLPFFGKSAKAPQTMPALAAADGKQPGDPAGFVAASGAEPREGPGSSAKAGASEPHPQVPAHPGPPGQPVAPAPPPIAKVFNDAAAKAPADPAPIQRPVVNLSIFQFSVPMGAVSKNEAFWKHVDEQAVDAYTYDILYKNGLRVGRAPLADWEYFQDLLERQPHQTKSAIYATTQARPIDLPMKQDVPQQTIYDFDARNVLSIRSYDASNNIFALEFQPAPRKRGDVRVTLQPKVVSQRWRIRPKGELDTEEFEFTHDEAKLPALWTDIPLDQVLIVAPSPEAASPMSVGHCFMVQDTHTQQLEDVLILVPQAMRLPDRAGKNAPATQTADAGK